MGLVPRQRRRPRGNSLRRRAPGWNAPWLRARSRVGRPVQAGNDAESGSIALNSLGCDTRDSCRFGSNPENCKNTGGYAILREVAPVDPSSRNAHDRDAREPGSRSISLALGPVAPSLPCATRSGMETLTPPCPVSSLPDSGLVSRLQASEKIKSSPDPVAKRQPCGRACPPCRIDRDGRHQEGIGVDRRAGWPSM